MALPVVIPNTFQNASVSIPLSQLDNNFSTVAVAINGIANGVEALSNVNITGGNVVVTNASVTTLDATNIKVTNIQAKDGTASASIANSTGVLTVASAVLTTADINGGTLDGAIIGGSSAAAGSFTTLSATGVATFSAGTSSAPAITTASYTGTGLFFPAANTIGFSNGAEAMRLNNNGYLGIGTNAPDCRLDVRDAIDTNLRVGRGFGQGNVTIYGPSGTNSASFLHNGSALFITQTGGTSGFLFRNTAGDYTFSTGAGNTERMRLDSVGNLGLGATPSGWASFTAMEFSNGNALYTNGSQMSLASNAYNDGSWRYKTTAAAGLYTNVRGVFSWFTAPSGTAGNAISFTQAMTLDASGRLGIGTTSPGARLDITSTAAFTARFSGPANTYIDVTDGTGTFRAQVVAGEPYLSSIGAYSMIFRTDSTERMRITSAGNLGVGTAAPVNKLQVSGSFGRGAPVTKTGNFTLADTENWVICNGTGTITVTLPAASSWTGREFTIKTIAAFTVVSASTNVVPLVGGSAGTAILAATAGAWATLVSDGTNWIIMQA